MEIERTISLRLNPKELTIFIQEVSQYDGYTFWIDISCEMALKDAIFMRFTFKDRNDRHFIALMENCSYQDEKKLESVFKEPVSTLYALQGKSR
jgi:hypothetical protein